MTGNPPPMTEADIARFQSDFTALREALNSVMAGQERLVSELLTAVVAGGHVLLEGPPGLGKTHLVKALANAVGMSMSRIQCTPDLMPSDITGSEVLVGRVGGEDGVLEFRPGPVFAPLVLVDEINRATPRTQSALLEAMQERQVSVAGARHPLPAPFWVLATQNPIEFEGTYPLPEAQLDRFMVKLKVNPPARAALAELALLTLDEEPADSLSPVVSPRRVQAMMGEVRAVVVAASVVDAAVELVLASHPRGDGSSAAASEHVHYGASPRALQSLLRLARVRALAAGRAHVSREDLAACAVPAFRHRILLSINSELADVDADAVLARILGEWSRQS